MDDISALVSVCAGLASEQGALFAHLEQFATAKAALALPAADALVDPLPAAALALLALWQLATPQEPDFCRIAAAATAAAEHATLRACGKYGNRLAQRLVAIGCRPACAPLARAQCMASLRALLASGALLSPVPTAPAPAATTPDLGTASGALTPFHASFLHMCLQAGAPGEGLAVAREPVTALSAPTSANAPLRGRDVVAYHHAAGCVLLACGEVAAAAAALRAACALFPRAEPTRTALDAFRKWLLASTLLVTAGGEAAEGGGSGGSGSGGFATPLAAWLASLGSSSGGGPGGPGGYGGGGSGGFLGEEGMGGGGGGGSGGHHRMGDMGDMGRMGGGMRSDRPGTARLLRILAALSPAHVALHEALCCAGGPPAGSFGGSSSSGAPMPAGGSSSSGGGGGSSSSGSGSGSGSGGGGGTLGARHIALEAAKRATCSLGEAWGGQVVRGDLHLAIGGCGSEVGSAGNATLLRAALSAYAGRALARLGVCYSTVTAGRAAVEAGVCSGGSVGEGEALAALAPVLAAMAVGEGGVRGEVVFPGGAAPGGGGACVRLVGAGEEGSEGAGGALQASLQGTLGAVLDLVAKVRGVEESTGERGALAGALLKGGRVLGGGGGRRGGGGGGGGGFFDIGDLAGGGMMHDSRYAEGSEADPAVKHGLIAQTR